ncbi:MAG: hypothetical protein ACI4OI_00920 [Gemmiger sp.]
MPEPSRRARMMAALCYLNVLILIPACTRWRREDFVKTHLNQGLVLLALSTICGALAMAPLIGELGFWFTLLVDALSLVGLIGALRGRRDPLPFIGRLLVNFHPFE